MYTIVPRNTVFKKVDFDASVIEDLVRISDDKSKLYCVLPEKFVDKCLDKIKNFEVYEDDIWIVTFPKSGTTWTQEMMWLICNDLNYEEAKSKDLDSRSPFFEFSGITTNKNSKIDYVEMCKNLSRPRVIKSHLPLFLVPNMLWSVKPKIVYVARNPKDVAVSFYHRHLLWYKGNKETFIDAFVKDEIIYQPYNEHVLEYWKIRNEPNILFLFYEDMKTDLAHEVKRAIKFLGKDFSQSQIDELCDHLSFDSLSKNKTVNKEDKVQRFKESIGEKYEPKVFSFFRKGIVGSYKQELSAEENQKLDAYIQHSEMKKFDFTYKFEN